MKRSVLLALLAVCSTISLVAQTHEIAIKGKIEGIEKGRLYLLTRSTEERTDTLGYCDFKKGKFELKGTLAEPMVVQLMVDGFSGGFTLFAEPGVTYKSYLSDNESFYIGFLLHYLCEIVYLVKRLGLCGLCRCLIVNHCLKHFDSLVS